METPEARQHLEMVEEILRRGEHPRPYRPIGWMLILLGCAAALIDAGQQGNINGGPLYVLYAGMALMLLTYVYIVAVSMLDRQRAERMSVAESRVMRAAAAIWIGIIAAAFAQPHIFSGWGTAAIWTVGGGIQMLMNGFFGDRRMLAGGIVLLVSLVVANYLIDEAGYILAGGFLAGYVLPGVLRVMERPDVCEARG